MTRDDIIRMALEAGCYETDTGELVTDEINLTRFAALVAAAERERCAQICDSVGANAVLGTAGECARAIRGQ